MRRGQERYAPPEGYDVGPFVRDKYTEMVVRKAGLFPGDRVLDVQTGTGILGVNIARAYTRSRVVVTDTNEANLAHARANAEAEKCRDRMEFVRCLPDDLPFKDEVFYFSTVGFRLCVEEEPLDTLDEIHRVTAFLAKIFAPALDFTDAREKPADIHDWVFTRERVKEMREIGFAKLQVSKIGRQGDGVVVSVVMTKRNDPLGGEDDEEEDEATEN